VVGKSTKVVIAYGSIKPKMSATDKGEAAVQILVMYWLLEQACHFKENKVNLVLVDEYNTTKLDSQTTLPKPKVHRIAK